MDIRPDIQIIKVNNTHIKIEAEESIKRELSDYFTFPVPGAKFMPSVRNKYWDGNIRLFAQTTGKIYTGLYYAVEQFARDRDYKIDGYQWETDIESPDFTDGLNMGFPLRDYQVEAISRGIKYRRQLLVSPTASGKSAIIYCIARHFISVHKKKVLVVTNYNCSCFIRNINCFKPRLCCGSIHIYYLLSGIYFRHIRILP